MIAVDTNVVVRFLTKDDAQQYRRAPALFRDHEVFLPETVLQETEWVLRHAYGYDSAAIVMAMRKLLGLPNVRVSDAGKLALATDWHELGLDFSDALHLAGSQHAEGLVTFDGQFIKRASDLGRCPVRLP